MRLEFSSAYEWLRLAVVHRRAYSLLRPSDVVMDFEQILDQPDRFLLVMPEDRDEPDVMRGAPWVVDVVCAEAVRFTGRHSARRMNKMLEAGVSMATSKTGESFDLLARLDRGRTFSGGSIRGHPPEKARHGASSQCHAMLPASNV